MVKKKLDQRIKVLIENGVALNHRSLFVIVGDKARDQVVILHHILSKARYTARPTVLWCYKKELGFSSHRKKRMRQLQKKIKKGTLEVNEDDPFELFIAATQIRYCYYNETHKILGNTYGMCVLQDFEALTPNLLARTIETVEGGGLVVLLLKSVQSLKQLYAMAMDVHSRYRTEAHQDVVCRFNERFILSLSSCVSCMAVDEMLNILPLSSHTLRITPQQPKAKAHDEQLKELKESVQDTQPLAAIVSLTKTLDQAKAVLRFVDAISDKTLRCTATLTAARGRGKSAALGLAIASAVAFRYSNIFVTSPSPENLRTLFDFIFKGFDALQYEEHMDYDIVQSTNPEFNKAVVRVNIFREHRQTIQYIHPTDAGKLGQAELVVIDEAAAIPLPLVKQLLGPYLVFISSTVNGYEGTGRSLSLKLIHQLRQQVSAGSSSSDSKSDSSSSRSLYELQLHESIRYAPGDAVESWLNNLLCLDVNTSIAAISSGCPVPDQCDLYYVNRDTLFCYHKASELFLKRTISIMVASHYKNSPNDLQMLSDAPAHHMFVLLGPVDPSQPTLPEVLCVIQVCLEGEISKKSVMQSLSRGKRAQGDLIPWTISQQFQDNDFPALSGARIIRIATHPDYQRMGYGNRALALLTNYYSGLLPNVDDTHGIQDTEESMDDIATVNDDTIDLLNEQLKPRNNLPPLLLKLSERKAEKLDYLGVSYGMTEELLRFWKKAGFQPVYLRQTQNELTGEHSCIMLKSLATDIDEVKMNKDWLLAYFTDFRRRFVSLLSYQFRHFKTSVALSILDRKKQGSGVAKISKLELDSIFTSYDLKRLQMYAQNLVDYHLILDLLPDIARLYFVNKLDIQLSTVQCVILLALGLQHKSVDDLQAELELPASQILALFNRCIRKVTNLCTSLVEQAIDKELTASKESLENNNHMRPLKESLQEELAMGEKEESIKQKVNGVGAIKDKRLKKYVIGGTDEDWEQALKGRKNINIVSVSSGKNEDSGPAEDQESGRSVVKKKRKKLAVSNMGGKEKKLKGVKKKKKVLSLK